MSSLDRLFRNRATRTVQVTAGTSHAILRGWLASLTLVVVLLVLLVPVTAFAWNGTGPGPDPCASYDCIAHPIITPANPINFGNVRIGSPQSQALSVTNLNLSLGRYPQESLSAQLGAASGAATSNGGSISKLAAGSTNDTSMVVGLDTATAGAQTGSVTMALSSCVIYCTAMNPYTVKVSGNVYRLANPALNTQAISLAARVGDTAPTATISITNTSPDTYTEGLAASLGAAPTGFSANGSISNLAAQATDDSSLHVALITATAGSFSGNQAVNFVSNGLIDHATAASVGSGDVALTGNVYTPAVAQVNTASPINFGIVHVRDGGGTLSRSISVTNGASVTALNDTLLGTNTVTNASGAAFSGTGSLGASGLAAQQTSTAMGVSLNTATAGVYSGTANLAFASHDSQLADLALTGASLGLQAQVNNYAGLAFSFDSGWGSLTCTTMTGGNCSLWTLDLGKLKQNSPETMTLLSFLNNGGAADYTDDLSSSGSVSSGSGFYLSNDSVSNLAGNASQGGTQGGFVIGLETSLLGNFNESLAFNVNSSNSSGYDENIGSVGLDLEGDVVSGAVTAVPEPGDLGMLGLGLASLGGLFVFDRWRHSKTAAKADGK